MTEEAEEKNSWNLLSKLPDLGQWVEIEGSDYMGSFTMQAVRVAYKKPMGKKTWRWQTRDRISIGGLRNLDRKETPERWRQIA